MTQKNESDLNRQETINLFSKKSPKLPYNTEKTKINNLVELKQLINRLKPGQDEENVPIIIDTKNTSMANDTFNGKVTIPQTGGQSTLRKIILEGFEMVKNHQKYHQASLTSQTIQEKYGGYLPAVAPNPEEHAIWIDSFINHNLGGKREGLYITWKLPDGKYKLDPWSCNLEKVNA